MENRIEPRDVLYSKLITTETQHLVDLYYGRFATKIMRVRRFGRGAERRLIIRFEVRIRAFRV